MATHHLSHGLFEVSLRTCPAQNCCRRLVDHAFDHALDQVARRVFFSFHELYFPENQLGLSSAV